MSPETSREASRKTSGAAADGECVDPDFGLIERTLIDGLRRMAAGRDRCTLTRREFVAVFGTLADDALAAFRCFFWTLAACGRRRLAVGFPGAGAASHDERLFLAVFAAAQAGAEDRLSAHLRWLAGGANRRFLAATATVVAKALASAGHRLDLPEPVRAATTAPAQLALTSFCRLRSPSGRG
jgi:hypothetical protein